ncbi:hypothetical protein [Nigerium sp.]|uniref:hypothetical protein n=1 Tax=Nigerium sp. TaxID=2042655 RepID=UPI0032215528
MTSHDDRGVHTPENTDAPATPAPQTGHEPIDAALRGVRLDDDVHTHHDALSSALDQVQQALSDAQRPGAPRS